MKIHFINNIIKDIKKIKEYERYSEDIHYIYSTDGIYIYDKSKNKLYNTICHDKQIERTYFKNKLIIIDNNSIIKSKYECYKFPFNYIELLITKKEYSLRENAKVKLVIESNDKNIDSWYFQTNEEISNIMIQDDINTFLSFIN